MAEATTLPRWQRTRLEIVGLLLAALTLAVSAYFGFRADKGKGVTVRILARRSLVTQEANRATLLTVEYAGLKVTQPWLVTLRIENSGSLPIEQRDVEQPIAIQFRGTRIVGIQPGDRFPKELDASATHSDSTVVVQHKLLNPGDWITLDVITDGEPRMPPEVWMRISGIGAPSVQLPSDPSVLRTATLPALPRPLEYVVLGLSSLTIVLSAILGIYGFADMCGWVGSSTETATVEQAAIGGDVQIANSDLTQPARDLMARAGKLTQSWADDTEALRDEIRVAVLPALINQLGYASVDGAVADVSQQVRRAMPAALAQRAMAALPPGANVWARDQLQKMVISKPIAAFMDDARRVVREAIKNHAPPKPVNWQGVGLVAVALLGIAGLATIVLAAWRAAIYL